MANSRVWTDHQPVEIAHYCQVRDPVWHHAAFHQPHTGAGLRANCADERRVRGGQTSPPPTSARPNSLAHQFALPTPGWGDDFTSS